MMVQDPMAYVPALCISEDEIKIVEGKNAQQFSR